CCTTRDIVIADIPCNASHLLERRVHFRRHSIEPLTLCCLSVKLIDSTLPVVVLFGTVQHAVPRLTDGEHNSCVITIRVGIVKRTNLIEIDTVVHGVPHVVRECVPVHVTHSSLLESGQ